MRTTRWGWLPAILALLCPFVVDPASTRAGEPPKVEVFAALPLESEPALSPNGHWLAWLDRGEPQLRVNIFDIDRRKVQRTLRMPEATNVNRLQWNNDETLLISLSEMLGARTPAWYHGIVAQDVSGGDERILAPSRTYMVAARINKPYTSIIASSPPPLSVAGSAGPTSDLKEVDTRTGASTIIKSGTASTVAWFVDRDGRPLAREDWDWIHNQFRVYAFEGESLREILHHDDVEPPIVGGVAGDGRSLVMLAPGSHGYQAAWELPLDGSPRQLLAEEPGADISSVWTDPYSGVVIGVFVSGREESVHWLDAEAKKRYELLAHAFPGKRVEPFGWSEDGARTLASVSSASSPPVYYFTDFHTHRADVAAEEYPALAGAVLAEVKTTTYKARDGTEIFAFLTLPSGVQQPVPLVVLPHGGPHARDMLRFDPLVQFLATRGYAVLQPQFRGSIGFGAAFRNAGFRQWGGLMQDDLTDAVRALVSQGTVDPRRVCIVGTSPYGGYAALAGAAFTPELYACAVSINGISDLAAWIRGAAPGNGRIFRSSDSLLIERVGGPRDASLRTHSPVNAAKSIKAPVLIMYRSGTGFAAEQSRPMAQAMKDAGKAATVVELPADDDWWSNTPGRLQVFQEVGKFLHEHLQTN